MQDSNTLTVTEPEAIRRAIQALGYQANVTEILEYARQNFGLGQEEQTTPSLAAAVPEVTRKETPVAPVIEPTPKTAGKRSKGKERGHE